MFYEQTSEINRSWIALHSLNISGGLQNLMDQRRRTIEEWILRRTEAWRFQEDLLVSNCEWSSHRTLPKTPYYKYYSLIFYKIEAYSNIYKKIIWLHINISYTKNRYIQEKQNIHVSLKMYIKSETIAKKMKQIYCNLYYSEYYFILWMGNVINKINIYKNKNMYMTDVFGLFWLNGGGGLFHFIFYFLFSFCSIIVLSVYRALFFIHCRGHWQTNQPRTAVYWRTYRHREPEKWELCTRNCWYVSLHHFIIIYFLHST